MNTEPAIDTARRGRARLHATMCDLEASASVPARSATWVPELTSRLESLRAALDTHIAEVESPDGIIAHILEDAPRLAAAGQQLRDDHPRLRALAGEVSGRLESATASPGPDEVREIRRAVLDLIGELSLHRQLGADFVYDAYSFDIGGQS